MGSCKNHHYKIIYTAHKHEEPEVEAGNNMRVLCATDNADYERRSGKLDGVLER